MDVIEAARRLAEQRKAAELGQPTDKAKLKQFAVLVYSIHERKKIDPAELLATLDACGRTLKDLQNQVELLESQRTAEDRIRELRADSAERIKVEKGESWDRFIDAKNKWDAEQEVLKHRESLLPENQAEATALARWLERSELNVVPRPEEIDA